MGARADRQLSSDELAEMRRLADEGRLTGAFVGPSDSDAVEIPAQEIHRLQAALSRAVDEIERLYSSAE